MLGNFSCILSSDIFYKIIFSNNSCRNNIIVSNSLDPDQAQQFIGPDLGPNCLQRLSADTSMQKVKVGVVFEKVNYDSFSDLFTVYHKYG